LKKIIAASNNKNKIHEIKNILDGSGYEVISLKEAGVDIDPEENSDTFEGNALIKARAAASLLSGMIIADDSGLAVNCLDGKPGVKSKRFAGPGAGDSDNNAYLIEQLKKKSCNDYNARFICVIALIDDNGCEYTFKGSCEGEIRFVPIGSNGFGYDPHFYVPEFQKTMAQLSDTEKNSISHRGNALKKLKMFLEGLNK